LVSGAGSRIFRDGCAASDVRSAQRSKTPATHIVGCRQTVLMKGRTLALPQNLQIILKSGAPLGFLFLSTEHVTASALCFNRL
jgi:hypothetical protein